MPVPYNVTDLFNNTTDTFPEILAVVNTASGNILGIGLLIAIFIIMYLINLSTNQGNAISLGVASLVTAVSSVFLSITGIVSGEFVPVTVVIAVISLAWLWWVRGTKATY